MKCYIVWYQCNEANAYLHLNGEQIVWSSKVKGAAEFTPERAARMVWKFNGSGPVEIVPLLFAGLPQGSVR